MKNIKYFRYAFYLLIGLLVFCKALSFLDPDFGWHLSTGNLILKSGFPKTDPFSYTMPSFPFIEHEWLVDVIFAKLYPITGLPGVSVLSSILFLSAVLVSVSKSKKFKTTLFIVGISSMVPFFSVSPKIFSWLLISFFIFAVFNETFWKRFWLLTPFIIILWVNLHGSFPEALVILLVILICKSFREKHIWLKGLLVTFLSFLATLVNPYGLRLWQIVWLTISDPLQRSRIAEWRPIYLNPVGFSFLAGFIFAISVILISRYWRRFKAEEIVLNLIFFTQAILAVRNVPLWILVDLPMTTVAIDYFYEEFGVSKAAKKRLLVLSKGVLMFVGAVLVFQIVGFAYLYSNFSQESSYPEGAVLYLEKNLPKGQLFSEYNWGGYLIWKLPEKKVFIYGMMPVWKWQSNISGESDNAMNEDFDLLAGKTSYKTIFNKYKIDTALLSTPEDPEPIVKFTVEVMSFFGVVGGPGSKNPFYEVLVKDGWRQVFKNNSSVILESPYPNNP